MMTSSNGNIIRVTAPLWEKHRPRRDKGQWREAFIFSLICTETKGWANNPDEFFRKIHTVDPSPGDHQRIYNPVKINLGNSKVCGYYQDLVTTSHYLNQGSSDSSEQTPDSKVHGANMGPVWDRQDPGGRHVGPMNFAICGYRRKQC